MASLRVSLVGRAGVGSRMFLHPLPTAANARHEVFQRIHTLLLGKFYIGAHRPAHSNAALTRSHRDVKKAIAIYFFHVESLDK